MVSAALEQWEEQFCVPFYLGGWQDVNSVYLETQRFQAACSQGGGAENLRQICATHCGTEWAGLNLAFLTEPVRAVERFGARLEAAREFYAARHLPWILVVPDQWVAPDQREPMHSFLQASGFQLAMDAYAVEALRVSAPSQLTMEIVTATAPQDWLSIAQVNAAAWSVPQDWVTPILSSDRFQAQARGYLADSGRSAIVEFHAAQYNFVAWWATLPGSRGKGLGEFMIRYAAANSLPGRKLLAIASPQGLPVFLRCGFMQGPLFRLYLAPGTHSA